MLQPNPQWDVFGKWSLWRWLGHKGEALVKEISAFLKETPGCSLIPLPHEDITKKTVIYEPEGRPSSDIESASILFLEF